MITRKGNIFQARCDRCRTATATVDVAECCSDGMRRPEMGPLEARQELRLAGWAEVQIRRHRMPFGVFVLICPSCADAVESVLETRP